VSFYTSIFSKLLPPLCSGTKGFVPILTVNVTLHYQSLTNRWAHTLEDNLQDELAGSLSQLRASREICCLRGQVQKEHH
jgi:hypothetical protein